MNTAFNDHRVTAPDYQLREFATYAAAEGAIERLTDNGYPVERTTIVGTGLRSVEHVTGRITNRGAACAGAGAGSWLGLFIGLMLGIFSSGAAWLPVVVVGVLVGAVWGAGLGTLAHRASRGRRDFSSVQRIEPQRYAIFVDEEDAAEAIRLGGLA